MNELYHHGVKGQRWGVRRYQNKDGSLTNAGKKRYKATNGNIMKKYKVDEEPDYSQWPVKKTISF